MAFVQRPEGKEGRKDSHSQGEPEMSTGLMGLRDMKNLGAGTGEPLWQQQCLRLWPQVRIRPEPAEVSFLCLDPAPTERLPPVLPVNMDIHLGYQSSTGSLSRPLRGFTFPEKD